jgi:hypothetical protein
MTHDYKNIDSDQYQLKTLSTIKRKPLPDSQVVPSKSPQETDDEGSYRMRSKILANRAYTSRWISNDKWMLEILSQLFSVLCMVAIVVLLAKINGSLLESWQSPVSPNAVISIASTAAKAALILPVAEALSQLKWLHFRTEGRP